MAKQYYKNSLQKNGDKYRQTTFLFKTQFKSN